MLGDLRYQKGLKVVESTQPQQSKVRLMAERLRKNGDPIAIEGIVTMIAIDDSKDSWLNCSNDCFRKIE